MSAETKIEWTDSTWQVTRGCARVSEGCTHCYAERIASRFDGHGKPFAGLIHKKTNGWNGKVITLPQNLQIPWRWSKGRRIFVNSMSDLFHESVPFEFIAAVFWVMSVTTRHTYQVLTKRPERMLAFFEWLRTKSDCPWPLLHSEARWFLSEAVSDTSDATPEVKALGWTPWREGKRHGGYDNCGPGWPYENVWLGVSVEDQAAAEARIPLLLQCPAEKRFLSCEPLLGPITFRWAKWAPLQNAAHLDSMKGIDWVIVGGESGPGARPMHPDWARSLRDQCAAAGVSYFFKQWGEWAPGENCGGTPKRTEQTAFWMNDKWHFCSQTPAQSRDQDYRDAPDVYRVGKRIAGRLLDGVEHNNFPEQAA